MTGAVLLAVLGGCVRDHGAVSSDRPTSFRVGLASGSAGTPEQPNAFSGEGVPFRFDVQALGPDGAPLDWDGLVRASVEPGRLVSVGDAAGATVPVAGGRAEDVEIVVAHAYGDVRVWFEDVGYEPAAPGTSECEDGIDQDGDRRIDFPDDPGCFASNDRSEEDGRGGTGLSRPLWFANPTLADVQGRASRSPLDGESITVDRGDLVVTRVAVDGLHVTDLDDVDAWGHLYLFNFSTPAGVRVCDRVSRIDGIVGEFFGYTELSFPSWETVIWDERDPCPVPEPAPLDAAVLGDAEAMESVEAGLVRVTDVTVATFVDCDRDGNGTIDFEVDGVCNEECACQNTCDADPLCVEENQFRRFGQMAVALDPDVGPKVFVVAADTVPGFDPAAHQGDRLASVTGTLRQIEFLDPPWMVEPRCPDDLVVSGDPVAATEACVVPRTEEEDEP